MSKNTIAPRTRQGEKLQTNRQHISISFENGAEKKGSAGVNQLHVVSAGREQDQPGTN